MPKRMSNSFTPSDAATYTTNNITTDYLPDVVVKVALDPGWGHYEAFALNRWFRDRNITAGQQVGGAPNTNINIFLVSFRYYPFQK